jgi:hypothetical protein
MIPIALATEDQLSEAVGLRLLAEASLIANSTPQLLRRNGFGYLKSRMDSWKRMAERQIVLVLTDLDKAACPLVLLEDWLGSERVCPQQLILRIAVREVESWLLADHVGLKQLIGKKGRLPLTPDELSDPKRYLLGLAQNAPRAVREDLIAQKGSSAMQGIGYNSRLGNWVQSVWCPQRAAALSPSLDRARKALVCLHKR